MNGAPPPQSVAPISQNASRGRTPSIRTAIVLVLVATLVSGVLLGWALTSRSATGPSCGGAVQTDPPTSTPIKHLFLIVKENHAFENYFGDLPGVSGYPPNASLPLTFNGTTFVHPFPLSGTSTPDLPHDATSSATDFNGGLNNQFVAVASAAGVSEPQDAAGYYSASQLPAYYAYAANYTLGDHFFTGFLGPTLPNRVFDITAYAGTWGSDSPPPAIVSEQPTILDQLNSARISWDYDWSFSSFELAPTFFPSISSNLCDSGQLAPVSSLSAQLDSARQNAAAPSVVYIDPADDLTYSEHPPENVTLGEEWTVGLVNAIFSSPVANSSAVLIWFDESGGFWDPIPPPLTSTGRDGFRVPFLVLSPWTPSGKVCSEALDPASVLRFIDQNWGLPFLNSRVAGAPDLSCFFNFSSPPRTPLLLASPINVSGPHGWVGTPSSSAASVVLSNPAESTLVAVWREGPGPSEAFWSPDRFPVRQEVEGS